MANRIPVTDSELENISGGHMIFDGATNILTWKHPETGVVKEYKILNLDRAFDYSNRKHEAMIREDEIIANLIRKEYISEM